jgi:hypothetical protein
MDDMTMWRMVDRLKIELAGRGLSLRKVDALLPKGKRKRHKLQPKKGRPVPVEDIFEILKVAKIDVATFLGQLAGYGHPLEVAAIRGTKAPSWSRQQRCILDSVEDLDDRGSQGFKEARAELRRLEILRDEDPTAADAAAWAWLEREKEPGAVVGLLSFLAVAAPRSNAHGLLQLAITILGGQLRSAAGARLATAAGRCFTLVGLATEGLSILENFALPIAALHGDNDDHAVALFLLAQAASAAGATETNAAALKKAATIGSDHLRFSAAQLAAFQELNAGDVRRAARMYDQLVGDPQYERETKRLRIAVACSRMSAHLLAGDSSPELAAEFGVLVQEAKGVLTIRDYIGAVIDLAVFQEAVGKPGEARRTLEAELWNALELEDSAVLQKFAELWEKLGLPKDARFRTLIERLASSEPLPGDRAAANQPPGT